MAKAVRRLARELDSLEQRSGIDVTMARIASQRMTRSKSIPMDVCDRNVVENCELRCRPFRSVVAP